MRTQIIPVLLAVTGCLVFGAVSLATTSGTLDFSLGELKFTEENGYDVVELDGRQLLQGEPGSPCLPVEFVKFLIPQDAKVDSVRIISTSSSDVPGEYFIISCQPHAYTGFSDPPPFLGPDPWWYSAHSPYPGEMKNLDFSGFVLCSPEDFREPHISSNDKTHSRASSVVVLTY